jgi:hypothetical protein
MAEVALKQVLERHRDRILRIEGVVGIAVGLSDRRPGTPCIVVYADLERWPDELPRDLEGHPVEVHRTAGFEAGGREV